MADLQKVYDSCIHFYDDCYDMLDRMSAGIKEVMEPKGVNYNPEVTLINLIFFYNTRSFKSRALTTRLIEMN